MKAEIGKDGYIHITAETVTEAFAIKAIYPIGEEPCDKCGQPKTPIVVDYSILTNGDHK